LIMKGQTHVEMLTIVAIGLGYRGSIVEIGEIFL